MNAIYPATKSRSIDVVDWSKTNAIVFDIETAAQLREQLQKRFVPKTMAEFVGGNNWLPATREKKYNTEYLPTAFDDYCENAAKSALTGRVLAIGWKTRGTNGETQVHIIGGENEVSHLETFWDVIRECQKIGLAHHGWNSNKFDAPFLVRRSRILGVPVPSFVMQSSASGTYLSGDAFQDIKNDWMLGDRDQSKTTCEAVATAIGITGFKKIDDVQYTCLLYTSDAADE